MKDPKTGKFYDVDMLDPKQLEEARKLGLVYCCMHYIPEDECGVDCSENYADIQAYWKQVFGINLPDLKKDEE